MLFFHDVIVVVVLGYCCYEGGEGVLVYFMFLGLDAAHDLFFGDVYDYFRDDWAEGDLVKLFNYHQYSGYLLHNSIDTLMVRVGKMILIYCAFKLTIYFNIVSVLFCENGSISHCDLIIAAVTLANTKSEFFYYH